MPTAAVWRCAECRDHSIGAALIKGGAACFSLGAEDWRQVLEFSDPPIGSALGRAIPRLEDKEAQERLRTLTTSRRSFRDQIFEHHNAKKRHDELLAMKEISSCGGGFVKSINLDSQFPPTNDQGDLGTCYAHTATGAAEAALFRNQGKRVNLSTVYGAACSRLPGMKKGGNPDLDGGGFAEDVIRGWIRRGHALKCEGGECLFADTEAQIRRNEEFINGKLALPFVGTLDLDKKKLEEHGINGAAIAVGSMEREAPQNLMPFSEDDYKLELLDQSPNDSNVRECPSLGSDPKAALRLIAQQLCKGIPVVTSLRMQDVDVSRDGGKTWRHRPYDPNRHSSHAMVATGIEWEGETPYLVFRNSWEEGTAEIPYASKARVPFSSHCRIKRASVITGPRDRNPTPAAPLVAEPASTKPH